MNDLDKADAVDDFLMHFGIMGMHWGIRNKSETITKAPVKTSVKKSHSVRNSNIIFGVVTAGAALTALLLIKDGAKPAFWGQVTPFIRGRVIVSSILKKSGSIPASYLNRSR